MDSQFRDLIQKGAKTAFMYYIVKHSHVADRLRSNCSEVITSTVKIIENDPETIAAIKDMPEDTVMEKII